MHSTSVRLLSIIARSTRRPMRPNPLMATFTAMVVFLLPVSRFYAKSAQALLHRRDNRLRRDAEMLAQALGRGRAAEAAHADEDALRPQPAVPAEADRGLDAHPQRIAQH